ncbi:cytochrome P450 [Ganoderma sinense ZZ0214-1]|uniref:Cytochrome P450 n=1 Tax=Ganoderma sinense ZZ0214-1 TaxID=1077348 RepID=A0A2G8RW10_9APHY|nr:cytochrome P450 [Ganoderma sinense ZZ0214-1]
MPAQDLQSVALACLVVAISLYALLWYRDPLRAIPTVCGPSLPGLSYIAAARGQRNFKELVEEGCRKYPESLFKVALPTHWLVVFSGRRMFEELRRRPDEELSHVLNLREILQTSYTLEPPLVADRYPGRILKERFTPRKLPDTILEVVDEAAIAVRQRIAAKDSEWNSVLVFPTMQQIIACAINRAFVGLPLCRNETFLGQAIGFTKQLIRDASLLRLVSAFVRPFIAPFLSRTRNVTIGAVPVLQPIIEERRRTFEELGEGWNDKPNDMLQFILDEAIPKGETLTVITQRVLLLNFASIHTTTSTLAHMIYHIAEKPELLQVVPLREEIEATIATDGWTATTLGKMPVQKLDSLLRETLHLNGLGLVVMQRVAAKDLTLCDGTCIPRGTIVCAAAHQLHRDAAALKNMGVFDPFRYARMHAAAATEDDGRKLQATTTSQDYLPFGHGPYACPGRYFAGYGIKAILAQIILEYDLKLGGDGVRPADIHVGTTVMPAMDGRVLFRKRGASSSLS